MDKTKLTGLRLLTTVIGYSEQIHPRLRRGQEVPGTQCLRVYLSRKLPQDQLKAEELVPSAVEGMETDCVVIGEVSIATLLPMQVPPTLYNARWAELISGISVGHGTITAGTLGCFVIKDSQDYILTNWHVAVGSTGQVGDVIYQPGPSDIRQVYGEEPSEKYLAGVLAAFDQPTSGGVDAALVKPTRAYNPDMFVSPVGVGGVHPLRLSGFKDPTVNMGVIKEGRTTGLTRGTVVDTQATISVNYGGSIGNLTFSGLIVIQGKNQAYLAGGDSGSVTREDAGQPERQAAVGLNFAGSTEGYGMAFKMSQVATELGFSFAPGVEPPAPPAKKYAPSDVLEVAILVEAAIPTRLSFFRTDRQVYSEGDPVVVEGQLVEVASGAPVPGVPVKVNTGQTVGLSLTTDVAGNFRGVVQGLPAGSHVLWAQFTGS